MSAHERLQDTRNLQMADAWRQANPASSALVAYVSGLSYYGGLDHIRAGDLLRAVREPQSPNHDDKNAIALWLRSEHQVGYVPAWIAAQLAPVLDRGDHLWAIAGGGGRRLHLNKVSMFGPAIDGLGWDQGIGDTGSDDTRSRFVHVALADLDNIIL